MSKILRFPFSEAELFRIHNIQVDNESDSTTINPKELPLHSMKISFQVSNDGGDSPRIQPLFPGVMEFFSELNDNREVPRPTSTDVDESNYDRWKTTGWIRVTPSTFTYRQEVKIQSIQPIHVWYGPIVIPKDFLFTSIAHLKGAGLLKEEIKKVGIEGSGESLVHPNDGDWPYFAIVEFLKGNYKPRIILNKASDPSAHDVVMIPMPSVLMDENRQVQLSIVVTNDASVPQDGNQEDFNRLSEEVNDRDPHHVRYCPIPAGQFLLSLRDRFIDPPNSPEFEKIFFPTNAPKYLTLTFTRTWMLIPNSSVYFPSQIVEVVSSDVTPGSLIKSRLPPNGKLFVRLPQEQTIRNITVSVIGGMKILKGETPNAWNEVAKHFPLEYDISEVSNPHIIIRRRLGEEMLVERIPPINGAFCTYLSLRRFIRSFIDHRISGGRLNNQELKSSSHWRITKRLIDQAIPGISGSVDKGRPLTDFNLMKSEWEDRVSSYHDREERKKKIIQIAMNSLKPIMEKMFPDGTPHSKGEIAFFLWVSNLRKFVDPEFKESFSPEQMGRGAAGAILWLGLADNYAFISDRSTADGTIDDTKYIERIFESIVTKEYLEPGGVLQWWNVVKDFEDMSLRIDEHRDEWSVPGKKLQSIGHSLIFADYYRENGSAKGIWVIDYHTSKTPAGVVPPKPGARLCDQPDSGKKLLQWRSLTPKIWVAANWNE